MATWVVYQAAVRNKPGVLHAVCEESEWEVLKAGQHGQCTLVRGGIASESEAEMLARGLTDSGARP